MKGNMTNKITTVSQVLPTDFIIADEYTVTEPGLSPFNKDQTISHKELIEYLKDNALNTINVLPMMSEPKTPDHYKDYDVMTSKIKKILDNAECEMYEMIEYYNEKYEENNEVYPIETADLSNLFSQLSDYCEDHQ